MVDLLLAGMLGYLLGSVPTGVLLCWAVQKVDVRQCGSGHTGGLNVSRVAGMWAGALTVAADTLLGVGAISGALLLTDDPWAAAIAGVMAMVGHDWSAFIRFGGGIGLSTLGGALLRLSPLRALGAGIVLVLLWVMLVRLLRIHRARATILAMMTLGPLLWAMGSPSPSIAVAVLGGAAAILKTLPDWSRRYE
jgi:glycerol-3-phosphate acyltransferase PlsY